ncbi:MAG: sugar transferase [Candidatus Zixiibacteriota bacterium]|nr:MAG: sugar transferase [candidate division Zixibacteria bacterium]
MNIYYAGSFFVAFASVLALIPFVKRWSLKVGFLDLPAGVKDHKNPTPLGGGLAVFIGSVVLVNILLIALGFKYSPSAVGLIAGSVIILLIGVYDDFNQMSAFDKLLGQLVCVFVFLFFAERHPPILSLQAYYLLSAVWILGIMNAINYIDNLDGLCGGVSLTVALGFGILFIIKGMPIFAIISFALAGGALGFLKYNLSPASIFLGDGGSLLFGFALACLGIVHFSTSKSITVALSPILIMAFPVFDMTLVTITRLNKGRKVYVASKDHAWDMIRILGFSKETTVYIILAINLTLVASGVVIFFMGESPLQVFLVFAFGLLLAFVGVQLYRNFLYLRESIETVFVDLVAVNLSFIIYFAIKYHSGLFGYYPPVSLEALVIPLAWINVFWVVLCSAVGLYDIYFERPFKRQLSSLLKGVAVGLVIFLIANYNPRQGMQISITSIGLFLLILLLLNALFRRLIFSVFKKRYFAARKSLKALVICPDGATPDYSSIEPLKRYYNITGYLGNAGYEGLDKIGEMDDLTEILRNRRIARVIVDYGDGNYSDIANLFSSAYYMETLFLVNDRSAANKRGFRILRTIFNNNYVISIKHRALFSAILKRLADFVLAGAALILTFPYPIYKILKARLKKVKPISEIQIVTLGEKEGKIKIDPSLSRSPFNRSFWALLSVVKGDLCLYGTTITTMEEYKSNLNSIPGYWRKFLAKPGLFGPGYSGKTPLERFKLDLAYMEKTSTWGDFWMIVKSLVGISPVKTEEL